jgi:hypothetical protein
MGGTLRLGWTGLGRSTVLDQGVGELTELLPSGRELVVRGWEHRDGNNVLFQVPRILYATYCTVPPARAVHKEFDMVVMVIEVISSGVVTSLLSSRPLSS